MFFAKQREIERLQAELSRQGRLLERRKRELELMGKELERAEGELLKYREKENFIDQFYNLLSFDGRPQRGEKDD